MECRVYRLEYDTEEGPPSGVNTIKKGNNAGLRGKIDAGHQQGNGQDRWKGIKVGQFTKARYQLALADDHRSMAKSMTYNQFERCVVGGCRNTNNKLFPN